MVDLQVRQMKNSHLKMILPRYFYLKKLNQQFFGCKKPFLKNEKKHKFYNICFLNVKSHFQNKGETIMLQKLCFKCKMAVKRP